MRLITFISLFVAALTGAALYLVSQQVQSTEAKLRELNRDIVKQEEAIHVLRAEWSYLNTPGRLKKLAKEHTDLRPMDGAQIAEINTLPDRPPEPETPEHKPGATEPGAEVRATDTPMADADSGDDAAEDARVVTAALKMPPLPGRKPRAPAMPAKTRTITAKTTTADTPVSTQTATREKPVKGPAPRSTERQFDMLLADLTGE